MQIKTTHYAWGLLLVIALIMLLALAGKHAVQPSDAVSDDASNPPVQAQTTTAPASSASASQPATASYVTIHVRRGGPTVWWSTPTTTVASEIQLSNPPQNTTAASPLSVSGLARGSWFFEGSMPIFLTDAKGKILAQGVAKAQSDWMTDGFVPFLGKLTFTRQPTGTNGVFVIKNDNPSGMPSKDKRMEVLVLFN